MLRFFAFAAAALCLCTVARADDRVPTGTLRVTYIATNPVQAFVDPTTNEVRGPAAAITAELARRAGVPFTITGAKGVEGVLASVKDGEADIGFVAFDPVQRRNGAESSMRRNQRRGSC